MGNSTLLGQVPQLRQTFNRRQFQDSVAGHDLIRGVVVDRSGYCDVSTAGLLCVADRAMADLLPGRRIW